MFDGTSADLGLQERVRRFRDLGGEIVFMREQNVSVVHKKSLSCAVLLFLQMPLTKQIEFLCAPLPAPPSNPINFAVRRLIINYESNCELMILVGAYLG